MKNGSAMSSQSPLMVEDEAAERIKKRLRDAGLIVNAGAGKTPKPVEKKGEAKR